MRSIFKYYLFCLLILLVSCGVKKNVTTSEQAGNTTAPDTLPDFLREFANDSTIHINWVYGIPFIIDDSVPMFLPPIDKNPENYVIKHIYAPKCPNSLPQETIYAIIDSIPWMNKCINGTKEFLLSHPKIAEHYHTYTYRVDLLKNNLHEIIEFRVFQEPIWDCYRSPYYRSVYSYYFDNMGNLLGKCARKMPYRLIYEHQFEYPIRNKLPNFRDFEITLIAVFQRYDRLLEFSVHIEPTPCLRGDDLINEGVKP